MRIFEYLAGAVLLASSALGTGFFTNPNSTANNTIYYAGSQIEVEWDNTADYSILSLAYVHESSNYIVQWLISNSPNYPTSYTWNLRPTLDGLSNYTDELFYLYVCNGTDYGAPFSSSLFYIKDESSTVTSSPATATATATARPNSATVPSTSTYGSGGSSESDDSAGGEGLSTGAKAGIGAGVGGAAVVAIGALAFWWRKRRSKDGHRAQLDGVHTSGAADDESPADGWHHGRHHDDSGAVHEQNVLLRGSSYGSPAVAEVEAPEKRFAFGAGQPVELPSSATAKPDFGKSSPSDATVDNIAELSPGSANSRAEMDSNQPVVRSELP